MSTVSSAPLKACLFFTRHVISLVPSNTGGAHFIVEGCARAALLCARAALLCAQAALLYVRAALLCARTALPERRGSTSLRMGSTSLRTGSTSLCTGSTSLRTGSTSLRTTAAALHSMTVRRKVASFAPILKMCWDYLSGIWAANPPQHTSPSFSTFRILANDLFMPPKSSKLWNLGWQWPFFKVVVSMGRHTVDCLAETLRISMPHDKVSSTYIWAEMETHSTDF